MTDESPEDPRAELLALVAVARQHAQSLADAGVTLLPKNAAARPAAAPAVAQVPAPSTSALQVIRDDIGDCQRCKLSQGRKKIVFGTGNPEAYLVFVGEAPGFNEDRQGLPFVGEAGQLLDKMIGAMGLLRDDVYIANIVKCRPPNNRNPEPDEIESCEPFLRRQLAAIRPRLIVCLGKFAAQTLLRSDAPISALRGQWKTYEGIPLMPTFHPAFLLRNPDAKREVWADLKLVIGEIDRLALPRHRA